MSLLSDGYVIKCKKRHPLVMQKKKKMFNAKSSNVCWAPVDRSAMPKKKSPSHKTETKRQINSRVRRSCVPFMSVQRSRQFSKHYEEEFRRLSFELGLTKKRKNKKSKKKKKKLYTRNEQKTNLSYENSVTMMISQRLDMIESQNNPEISPEVKMADYDLIDTQERFMQDLQMMHEDERRADHEYAASRREKLLNLKRQTRESLGSPPGPGDYKIHKKKKPVRRHSVGCKVQTASKSRTTWMDTVLERGKTLPGPALYSDGVNKSSVHRKKGLRFSKALRIKKDKPRSPGPCKYSPSTSTLKTSGVSMFAADTTRHFDTIQQRAATIPGPADYGPEEDLAIKKKTPNSPEWGLTQVYSSMRKIYARPKMKAK